MRKLLGLSLILSLLFPPALAVAESPEAPKLTVGKKRYLRGQDVRITVTNDTKNYVTLGARWRIENTHGDEIASYAWEEDERTLAPLSLIHI